MQIDFTNDVFTIFGQPQNLLFTLFDYYCIPIGRYISTDGTVPGNKAVETVLYNFLDDCSDYERE